MLPSQNLPVVEAQYLWLDSIRVDWRPQLKQRTDQQHTGYRLYTRKMGYHHSQGRGENFHTACQTDHHR